MANLLHFLYFTFIHLPKDMIGCRIYLRLKETKNKPTNDFTIYVLCILKKKQNRSWVWQSLFHKQKYDENEIEYHHHSSNIPVHIPQ